VLGSVADFRELLACDLLSNVGEELSYFFFGSGFSEVGLIYSKEIILLGEEESN